MDPNQAGDQKEIYVEQERSHNNASGPLDELVQLAQDVMGKRH
jgi:hypothetical protein